MLGEDNNFQEDKQAEVENFNDIFGRPPNFCDVCGELLDFELIREDSVECQKCGGLTLIESIIKHEVETVEIYENCKEWMNKLKNKEDKLKAKQTIKRSIVINIIYYITLDFRKMYQMWT
jgi:hypothetical protein